jgi:hypothetical protein
MVASLLTLTVLAARAETELVQPTVAGRADYRALLSAEAIRQGLPTDLADAVTTVESAYDARALGSSGEIGLMQVMPSTAAMLGFRGTVAELAVPATNIHFGVTYLSGAWALTQGRLCDTLMKYRAGYGEAVMSVRSIIYCHRAIAYLTAIGSPLATGPGTDLPPITPAMLAADAAAPRAIAGRMRILLTSAEWGRMHSGHRTAEDSRHFWALEEGYIKRLRNRKSLRHLATLTQHRH